jgi:antitoxin ChpS
MSVTNLRKVGGSIMLAVPPSILSLLKLEPGSPVDVAVEEGRLVIEPVKKPKYTLEELLAQCKPVQKRSAEDEEWLNVAPVGKELF